MATRGLNLPVILLTALLLCQTSLHGRSAAQNVSEVVPVGHGSAEQHNATHPYHRLRIVIVTAAWNREAQVQKETEMCLKSLFRHTRADMHITFITTNKEREVLRGMLQQLVNPGIRVTYSFTHLHTRFVEARALELQVPIVHHAGVPGYAKFLLTQLLPHEDRIILLDTDILVGSDLSLLWDEFSSFTDETLFAFPGSALAQEQNLRYFCTCVGLLDLGRMRDAGWDGDFAVRAFGWYNEVHKGELVQLVTWGDQSMYLAVAQHYQPTRKVWNPLPLSWNLEHCHYWHGLQPDKANKSALFWGIIHFNCYRGEVAAKDLSDWGPFFTYIEKLPWAWLNEGRTQRTVHEIAHHQYPYAHR